MSPHARPVHIPAEGPVTDGTSARSPASQAAEGSPHALRAPALRALETVASLARAEAEAEAARIVAESEVPAGGE